MSFAENQLKKYGWKEGDGIGKTNQGMLKPIKASLKFDTTGVGFNLSEQFTTNWWENLYNTTASSIDTSKEIKLNVKKENQEDENKVDNPMNRKSYFYSRFQKGSTLIDGRTLKVEENKLEQSETNDQIEIKNKNIITDEDLYKLCEGRTAHKGARHGIKMNGKLARIEEQEKILYEKLISKANNNDNNNRNVVDNDCRDELVNEEKKKKKKRKEKDLEEDNNEEKIQNDENSDLCVKKKKKSKKSKKESDYNE